MSVLERVCAQCQGKMARFEIVRIKGFNVYKKTTPTHSKLYSFNRVTHAVIKHFNACNVVQLHAAVAV